MTKSKTGIDPQLVSKLHQDKNYYKDKEMTNIKANTKTGPMPISDLHQEKNKYHTTTKRMTNIMTRTKNNTKIQNYNQDKGQTKTNNKIKTRNIYTRMKKTYYPSISGLFHNLKT